MTEQNNSAMYAEGLYIGNLLFVGLFYLILLILFALKFKKSPPVIQSHLKHTLLLSTITTGVFAALNIYIMMSTGYSSAAALIILEIYYMVFVPVFLLLGILGFMRATQQLDFCYPFTGKKCLP